MLSDASDLGSPWRHPAAGLVLIALLLLAGVARATGAAQFDAYASQWAEQSDVSGAWCLLRGDVVLAAGARGSQRGSFGRPITTDTAFWIGSNSKQFAAAAVLRLVEQERVELSAPITRYFPELKAESVARAGQTCSVEHVLSHRCGLVRDPKSLARVSDHLSDPKREARLLDAVNEETLAFDPGTKYLYSNLGYALMGLLVQRASGKQYEQYLQEEFWGPLGMTRTGIRPRDGIQLARGQADGAFAWVDAADWLFLDLGIIEGLGASGNIFSTARDLALWTHALHHGKVLQPPAYAELIRPRAENYALGLMVSNEAIGKLIHHNGELAPYGYSSQVAYLPEHDLTAVVLTNRPMAAGRALPFAGTLLRKASAQPENPPATAPFLVRLERSSEVLQNALILPFSFWMLLRRVRQRRPLDRQNWWLSFHIYAVLIGGSLSAYRTTALDPWLVGWAVLTLAGVYKSRWWHLPNWQRRPGLAPYAWLALRSLLLLALLVFSLPHFLVVFAVLMAAEAGIWLLDANSRGVAQGRPMSAR